MTPPGSFRDASATGGCRAGLQNSGPAATRPAATRNRASLGSTPPFRRRKPRRRRDPPAGAAAGRADHPGECRPAAARRGRYRGDGASAVAGLYRRRRHRRADLQFPLLGLRLPAHGDDRLHRPRRAAPATIRKSATSRCAPPCSRRCSAWPSSPCRRRRNGSPSGPSRATPRVEGLAAAYFDIRVWGAPAALTVYVCIGWLIGMERTGAVLALTLYMNGLNIALDLLFVPVFGWGIEGVALATLIAEVSAAIIGIAAILRLHRPLDGRWRLRGLFADRNRTGRPAARQRRYLSAHPVRDFRFRLVHRPGREAGRDRAGGQRRAAALPHVHEPRAWTASPSPPRRWSAAPSAAAAGRATARRPG